MGTLTSPSPF